MHSRRWLNVQIIVQIIIDNFKRDLSNAEFVGSSCRHLYQRIDEHRYSTIGNEAPGKRAQNQDLRDLKGNFSILKKCQGKLDWLIFEIL